MTDTIPFLVTGAYRTGTTLVDKVLDAHPSVRALSQPIPAVYRHLKKVFYQNLGITEEYYVLSDLFQPGYTGEDLTGFLKHYRIARKEFKGVLRSMEGWSGQSTRLGRLDDFLEGYGDATLCELYRYLLHYFMPQGRWAALGTKEILIEEFIPYMLECGLRVILVLRDPRDMYTSINVGRGREYTGRHRPTLFHLRNWRKSVALANTWRDHDNCLVIRYEDLLEDADGMLKQLTGFLGVEAFAAGYFDNGIPTREGPYWSGNSSTNTHRGINPANQGKHKKYLAPDTIGYIEYMCHPEMRVWGYEEDTRGLEPEHFQEPFEMEASGLNPAMSTDGAELRAERRRLELLKGGGGSRQEIISLFYSLKNYQTLKKHL